MTTTTPATMTVEDLLRRCLRMCGGPVGLARALTLAGRPVSARKVCSWVAKPRTLTFEGARALCELAGCSLLDLS